MSFPDPGRGWVGPAASAARALLESREFDVLVTSGPPHSAHFAGFFALRRRSELFWIDMRDPWSATHAAEAPLDQLVLGERFILSRFEKLLFQRATKVIANTPEFAASLRSSEPTLDVTYFPNGIDLEQLPARDPSKVQLGSIACIGALYAGRSLSSVIRAMGAVLAERPVQAANLALNIAGPIELPHREKLTSDIAAAGVENLVHIHGVIPRAQALEMLNGSHLALVLAQDQPMQIPAKLYECVGLGVATLVIAEQTSAAAREARRIGAMTVADSDADGLRAVLSDLVDGRLPIKNEPRAPISYQDLAGEMDRLLKDALRGERVPESVVR